MKTVNRSKLSFKIFITLSGVLFSLFFCATAVVYTLTQNILTERLEENLNNTLAGVRQLVETSATLSIRSYLRSLAEQNKNIVQDLDGQYRAGTLTRQEAELRAADILLAQKIAGSGYIYSINSQGRIVIHPNKAMVGADMHDHWLAKMQVGRKNGFIEYAWQNPGESKARAKLLSMEYFAPWDWIISVSAYRDELSQLINVDDLREQVLAIKIGAQGYSMVLDQKGELLIHPSLEGNFENLGKDDAELLQNLINQKSGKITYQAIGRHDGKKHNHIAVFSTIEDFGWLVVATSSVEDFYAPLTTLRTLFLSLLVIAISACFFVSIYLSRSITAPLNKLLTHLSGQSSNAQLAVPEPGNKNEIEELSEYFKSYVRHLHQTNRRLTELLEEQKQTALDLSIFKEVFYNIVEGISITNAEGVIIQANPAFEKITGYTVAEAIGNNPKVLKSNRHPPEFYQNMWRKIIADGFWSGEIWNKRKNGQIYPEWLTISSVRDATGQTTHYAAVFNDISTLVQQQERIQFLAYHDHLTELPNRLLLLERMHQTFSACKRHGGVVVCMMIDLDNFKTVNDSIGHDVGDLLLKEFVKRIQPTVRAEDTLCRWGGDEFVLLFQHQGEAIEKFFPVISRINSAVEQPFVFAEQRVYMTLSIGIAIHPTDAETTEDLVKHADLALNDAKQSPGNSYAFFNSDMEIEVKKKLHFLAKIRSGLEHLEFLPYFQPKVDLISGEVVGMEALARWKSAEQLISPGDFIPISEQSGLIIPLAKQIYEQAFRDTALLFDMGYRLKLSVNLSPSQLLAENFLEELVAIQETSCLPTEFIELEVTESSLMKNVAKSRRLLEQLGKLGFSLSIDDFGTGYSSLQYLKQLPLNTLKIDMSFVSGIGRYRDDEKLIETIILMARQFGLTIVAEGVEGSSQEDFLRSLGCHYGQGYLYGKPMDMATFTEWLKSRQAQAPHPRPPAPDPSVPI
jgi:diguanylate cyclase (GGDEF)-like protein/PAS domain S-box-containing protein